MIALANIYAEALIDTVRERRQILRGKATNRVGEETRLVQREKNRVILIRDAEGIQLEGIQLEDRKYKK